MTNVLLLTRTTSSGPEVYIPRRVDDSKASLSLLAIPRNPRKNLREAAELLCKDSFAIGLDADCFRLIGAEPDVIVTTNLGEFQQLDMRHVLGPSAFDHMTPWTPLEEALSNKRVVEPDLFRLLKSLSRRMQNVL